MSEDKKLFRGSTGLNTVVDPVRAPFDPETGISDLTAAVNVVVDRTGRVSRRDGFANIFNGASHSLFCDGGACLFVTGDELCLLEPDYVRTVIRTGMVDARVDYAQVNDQTYYVNGSQLGVVFNGSDHAWAMTTTLTDTGNRKFIGPIAGEHIAFHLGRIFLSSGTAIMFSEPFAFSHYDLARNIIPLESRIIMMKPVSQGLFISTEKATYFMSGLRPEEFTLLLVAPYPAVEWSAAIDLVDGLEIGLQEPGLCALWASPKGACLGTATGQFRNLTRDKVVYPETSSKGAGLLRGYDFIQNIY